MGINLDHLRVIWSYDWRKQAERDASSIIATMKTYRFNALAQELYYGLSPQVGGSPTTIEEIHTFRLILKESDILLIPVVVPRGLQGEAELHAEIAKECGCILVDLEVDSSGNYWPDSEISLVQIYARALRAATGPDIHIGWQPDGRIADLGRNQEWNYIVGFCDQYINSYWPQLYTGWSDYGVGVASRIYDFKRFTQFKSLGKFVAPTLYSAAPNPDDFKQLWLLIQDFTTSACAFAMGATGPDGLAAFANLEGINSMTQPQDMSPSWQLRIGLSNRLSQAQEKATDSSVAPQDALAYMRNVCQSVIANIDLAGGFTPASRNISPAS